MDEDYKSGRLVAGGVSDARVLVANERLQLHAEHKQELEQVEQLKDQVRSIAQRCMQTDSRVLIFMRAWPIRLHM